jgi:uncharacterized membrane protein YphA (DoxX/SURF4 family)
MNLSLIVAQAVSALGFLAYGAASLTTRRMRDEFTRFGLPHLRVLTACLQIAAGTGLLLGYQYPVCALLSASGLSFMMLVAVGVRVKIKDPLSGFFQALVCLLLNLFILREQLLRFGSRG